MVRFRDGAGRLPRHRAVYPVGRAPVRVPIPAAHAGDQGRTDVIALDGERVIRVGDVDVLDPGEQEIDLGGMAGRAGKAVEDAASQGVPEQVQPPNHRGDIALDRSRGGWRREGVRFPDTEVGRPHRLDDLVRDPVPTDIAEGAARRPGDRAVAAGRGGGAADPTGRP